jgi:hypothetical protein
MSLRLHPSDTSQSHCSRLVGLLHRLHKGHHLTQSLLQTTTVAAASSFLGPHTSRQALLPVSVHGHLSGFTQDNGPLKEGENRWRLVHPP